MDTSMFISMVAEIFRKINIGKCPFFATPAFCAWRPFSVQLYLYSALQILAASAAAAAAAKSRQSCLTLCNPIDGSSQGSQVPGILQARVLEWVAIAFSESEC